MPAPWASCKKKKKVGKPPSSPNIRRLSPHPAARTTWRKFTPHGKVTTQPDQAFTTGSSFPPPGPVPSPAQSPRDSSGITLYRLNSDEQTVPLDDAYTETVTFHDRVYQRYAIDNRAYFAPIDEVSLLGCFLFLLSERTGCVSRYPPNLKLVLPACLPSCLPACRKGKGRRRQCGKVGR